LDREKSGNPDLDQNADVLSAFKCCHFTTTPDAMLSLQAFSASGVQLKGFFDTNLKIFVQLLYIGK
jgi:hypothetical protein